MRPRMSPVSRLSHSSYQDWKNPVWRVAVVETASRQHLATTHRASRRSLVEAVGLPRRMSRSPTLTTASWVSCPSVSLRVTHDFHEDPNSSSAITSHSRRPLRRPRSGRAKYHIR